MSYPYIPDIFATFFAKNEILAKNSYFSFKNGNVSINPDYSLAVTPLARVTSVKRGEKSYLKGPKRRFIVKEHIGPAVSEIISSRQTD